MKNINNYINESLINTTLVFENVYEFNSLQDVYEALGDKILYNFQLNEGLGDWLRKLADKGDKLDKAAADLKNNVKDKVNKMSDAGKQAIENIKQKAGEKWDSIKDTYTSVVATVDDVIINSKNAIADMAKKAGQKIEDVEATIATVYTNAIASGKELGKAIIEWTKDKTVGAAKLAALNSFYLGAVLAQKAGIKSDLLIELMTAAGIQ